MRKIVFSLFLASWIGVSAQDVTIREVFRQMPDSIVPYLAENNRLDCMDFIDSKMEAVVTNSLGGKSKMIQLTEQFLAMNLNSASTIQMRLLPVEEPVDSARQVVCVVRTYGTDHRESTVMFYSTKWRQLPASEYMTWPEGYRIAEAQLSAEEPVLTLSSVQYLDLPANEEQQKRSKTSISLKWIGRFIN